MLFLFACTALWAAAQQPQEDLEAERARLQAIRKNPEAYARLRDNLNAFEKSKKQDAVKKLDADLHSLPPARQDRYFRALGRYADWLDRLKKSDPNTFRAIASAPDAATRLALIKDQRDREWMETQPKAYREQWTKLQGDARGQFVADRRREERTRNHHWLIASRFWKELESKQALPARLSDFSYKPKKKDKDAKKDVEINPVKDYVDQYLLPQLTAAQKKQLEDAEGRWPDFPMALVALASKHPTALPPKQLPTRFKDLPESVQRRFDKNAKKAAKLVKEIKDFEGPNFASNFAKICKTAGIYPFGRIPDGNEYLACLYKHLTPPMQKFVEKQLVPAMKDHAADVRKLADSEGKWPEYPVTIQELSAKYHLRPPWHILPDADRFHFDRYRPDKNAAVDLEKTQDKEAD
jgi:hypothetical protein